MKSVFLAGAAVLAMGSAEVPPAPPVMECSAPQTPVPERSAEARTQNTHMGILISGPPSYISGIGSALDLICGKDPPNCKVVKDNIKEIVLTGHSGMYCKEGRYTTDDNEGESTEWIAGEIVHDAWHREYYRRKEPYLGREGEKKCMERQYEFFRKVGYPELDIEKMLATEYWMVPLEDRDW